MDPKGSLNDGVFEFDEILSATVKGKERVWKQFVRLVATPHADHREVNWNMDEEKMVDIKPDHMSGSVVVPDNTIAQIWTETGQVGMNMMRSAPKYISVGKNIGRSNETNIVQQAIRNGISKWNTNFKKRKGAATDNARIKPMALHSLPPQNSNKDFDIECKYWKEGVEVYVEPKIDGNRLIIHMCEGGKLDLYNRRGDSPRNPLPHIIAAATKIMEPGDYLDGELYIPGRQHQEINGLIMNESADASAIQYHVFDIIDTARPYSERRAILEKLNIKPPIFLVSNKKMSRMVDIKAEFYKYVKRGDEGMVVRYPEGMYQTADGREVRSKHVLKLKELYDDEYEIVGYASGKGRFRGVIVWKLITPEGHTFNAKPAVTVVEGRALYDQMAVEFETNFKGKMMTILFLDKTNKNIPRFPVAHRVRE